MAINLANVNMSKPMQTMSRPHPGDFRRRGKSRMTQVGIDMTVNNVMNLAIPATCVR